jgi:hypothetical protein
MTENPAQVAVDPAGYPVWAPHARAMVALPAPQAGLTIDELRVLDVLTGNELMIEAGDPLWDFTADDYAPLTPAGWVWAHLAGGRRLALVPADLHGARRRRGGLAGVRVDRSRRGIAIDDWTQVTLNQAGTAPRTPGLHPHFGFVVDQPFFGPDQPAGRFADRLTGDFEPVGFVQGGLLARRRTGPDQGSIWYWDDDDPRDNGTVDPAEVCARLLHRCAEHLDAFWDSLAVVPERLLDLVDRDTADGRAVRLDTGADRS